MIATATSAATVGRRIYAPPVLEDQALRLRTWVALAWPYLDTEPTEGEWIESAQDLDATGLPDQTLQRLQQTLVGPVLRGQAYYGRWIGLVPDLADQHTKAIDDRWQQGDWGKNLSLLRRLAWRQSTGDYWKHLARLRTAS